MAGKEILSRCLELALQDGASDIHLYEGERPRLRVQGNLRKISEIVEPDAQQMREILDAIAGDRVREQFLSDGACDFGYGAGVAAEGKNIRLRVSASRCLGKILLVFRLLVNEIPTMQQLGLPEVLGEIAMSKSGLFLVTGRSGMGKSTTLAAMIAHINATTSRHIVTIEDPVEFLFMPEKSMIHQREVGTDSPSFLAAIMKGLRQDINVIMIGELRDFQTIQAALTAAETGHFVLATLHTKSAAQSVARIVDVFPGDQQNQVRAQLSMTLRGVLSQQLVPAKNGRRVAACELLLANAAVRNCIRELKTEQLKNIMQTAGSLGMTTMDRSLAQLCQNALITEESARQYAYDRKELENALCIG